MTGSARLLLPLLLATQLACSNFADPINDAARREAARNAGGSGGSPGAGGSGGTAQDHQPLDVVEAVIAGQHEVLTYQGGGVTPDLYTMILAGSAGSGPTLQLTFDGNEPGTYACGAASRTQITYAADAMLATSAVAGDCTIVVTEVGSLLEPIRGTFTAHLTTRDGEAVDVTEGVFDVTNAIP